MRSSYDVAIVGAGPAGLATALHARQRNLRAVVIDKGAIANHIMGFPVGMAFFGPRHSLELSGIPLDTTRHYPTREEVISYYGRVARLAELEIRDHETFERLEGGDEDFRVVTRTARGERREYHCRKFVLATGVFGHPRRLGNIPGAQLPKVEYMYREPFEYIDRDVLLVGAGNSSAGAALALYHAGARVTVVDRNPSIASTKWRWHLEDLQTLVKTGEIKLIPRARVTRIDDESVTLDVDGTPTQIANDAVIAQLGYEPDVRLIEELGIALEPTTKMPAVDVRTFESNRAGVYLAGIVCAGSSPDKVFVWGSRNHPRAIMRHILREPPMAEIRDLGAETIEHWRQFESVSEDIDEDLARRIVPVVTGEMRDDFFDIYSHATGSENLYAEAPVRAASGDGQHVGSLIDALEGWLIERNADGSVTFKGQRLSANAIEILKYCDGTRRLSDVIDAVAAEFDQDRDEVAPLVFALVVSLLRNGRLTWRPRPMPRGLPTQTT